MKTLAPPPSSFLGRLRRYNDWLVRTIARNSPLAAISPARAFGGLQNAS